MPFNNSFRFNDKESGFPVSPYLRKQGPEEAIPISKIMAFDVSFLHCQLLMKGQILRMMLLHSLKTNLKIQQVSFPSNFNINISKIWSLFLSMVVFMILNKYVVYGRDRYHSINFKAQNLPSGIYYYRLFTNEQVLTKKMILIN